MKLQAVRSSKSLFLCMLTQDSRGKLLKKYHGLIATFLGRLYWSGQRCRRRGKLPVKPNTGVTVHWRGNCARKQSLVPTWPHHATSRAALVLVC